jgi:DNA processing protein
MDYLQLDTLAGLILRDRPRAQRLLALAALGQKPAPGQLTLLAGESSAHEQKCAEAELLRAKKIGIQLVPITAENYPAGLKPCPDAPFVLSVKGSPKALAELQSAVAIVGSRNADEEGCSLAREYAAYVTKRGACVVSGLAYGIDGHAHAESLRSGRALSTIAVLGQGLGTAIYPRAHQTLAQKIIESGGILISQFGLDEAPLPGHFLNRNRVIAGLSQVVVVIQAGQKSGALVTARYAAELGRDVLVVPGSVRSELYIGSHSLIQQGAFLISKPAQLEEHVLGLTQADDSTLESDLSAPEAQLCRLLQEQGPMDIESLLTRTDSASGQVLLHLSELELRGRIQRLPGNRVQIGARGPT